jgi:hypothetical protein
VEKSLHPCQRASTPRMGPLFLINHNACVDTSLQML